MTERKITYWPLAKAIVLCAIASYFGWIVTLKLIGIALVGLMIVDLAVDLYAQIKKTISDLKKEVRSWRDEDKEKD